MPGECGAPLSRWQQGLAALRPNLPPHYPALIDQALTPEQALLVRALPTFDQVHLCRVYERLLAAGECDSELLTAALLHDVGKAESGRTVALLHRVLYVMLRRWSPNLLRWLAREPASAWRSGFALAVHHPKRGAAKAAAVGCSPRVCWLIAEHETDPPPDDPGLRRLIAFDNAS